MSPWIKFSIAIVMLVVLVVGGTVGYTVIEPNYTPSDGLYMTVITITTVGFGEVHRLSEKGRHFTIVLLFFSVLTAGYSVTSLIGFVVEGHILQLMRGRRMERKIARLTNHYIICGCGVVGKEVAMEFQEAGVPFLIIEMDPEHSELSKDESILFLEGSAEDDETLLEAGIQQAKGLVAALRQDEANVFVVLTARQLNPNMQIVARAAEERTVGKLMRAGANRVISPYQIAGRRIASVILRPSVMDFLDVMVEGGDVTMRMEQVVVVAGSPMVGKALRESGIGQKTRAIILGILGPDGKTRTRGSETTTLASVVVQEGDVLISLGSEDELQSLKAFAEGQVAA